MRFPKRFEFPMMFPVREPNILLVKMFPLKAVSPMMTLDVKRSPLRTEKFPNTLEFPTMFPVNVPNVFPETTPVKLLAAKFPTTVRFPKTVEFPTVFPVKVP